MRLVFGPEAEAELAAAFDYYESVASGLGLALIEDLDTLVRRIRGNPALYVQVHGFMRRAVLRLSPPASSTPSTKPKSVCTLSCRSLATRGFGQESTDWTGPASDQ
jgi:hypothetical protein